MNHRKTAYLVWIFSIFLILGFTGIALAQTADTATAKEEAATSEAGPACACGCGMDNCACTAGGCKMGGGCAGACGKASCACMAGGGCRLGGGMMKGSACAMHGGCGRMGGMGMKGGGMHGMMADMDRDALDATREMRREMHMKKFDLHEAMRNPDISDEEIMKMREELDMLKLKIKRKAMQE